MENIELTGSEKPVETSAPTAPYSNARLWKMREEIEAEIKPVLDAKRAKE